MSETNQKFYQDYHELVELMKKSDHNYNYELVDKAYKFAEEKHGDQRRASGIPYILHPTSVACILAELGMDSESIAAALLHDVVEDTEVTLEDLTREGMPDEVVRSVALLTHAKHKPYAEYIENLLPDEIARKVKKADIGQNSLADRNALVALWQNDQSKADRLAEKYAKAIELIENWEAAHNA